MWDVQTQKQVGELIGLLDITYALAFSPDGTILASAGGAYDKAVYLWDFQAQKQVGVLGGHSAHIGSIAFSPDGKLLASTVYWDDTVHFWDVKGQKQVGVLKGHDASDMGWGDQVAFSSNGKWLACGSENGVELWELNLPGGTYAGRPKPANRATDVPRDVVLNWTPGIYVPPINGHKVYFSESFNDVNDRIGGIAQDANSYTPAQRLDFDKTYYWRVDEVNGPPDYTVFKGSLWSFTTEPIAYAIEIVTATASSGSRGSGPEDTVNGSGLDETGLLHGKDGRDMWLSGSEPNAWIEYEFDKVCKLHEMWVWNYNGMMESVIGFGLKDVTIEYSTNGTDYTTLAGVPEFAQAPETPDYAHNTTVDFSGVAAKYVRLTANSNWKGTDRYGLSEVRFFSIPVFAREPSPDVGATDVAVDVTLGFRAGREAVTHDVYLSSDEQVVIDGNVPVSTVAETSFGPLSLDLGTTYYWKINEVNDAETTTTWQGDIWNFTTEPGNATQPDPANNAVGVSLDKILSWSPGPAAATHDVYFGTTSPLAFIGNQADSSYDPGGLKPSTTYYWQIDEVEADGTTKHTGDIWSFTTEPGNATQPDPANNAVGVALDKILSWSPGPTAATHDVYFSTSSPPAFIGSMTEFSFDPGPLEVDTTYYWQIDEVEADGTTIHTGDIWRFTTVITAVKKGPYLIYPGDNTQMTVLWQLEMTSDCTLEWGTDTNYGNSLTSSEYGTDHQHQPTITALAPGAKYYYRVQVEAEGSYLTGSFLAAPAADAQNVKFLAYGDTRTNPGIHDAVNAEMIATYTADPAYQTFTMLTGDWVANGDNESDWTNQFFNRSRQNTIEMQANLPINGCIGNHERSGTVFEKYWPYPYESGGRYWSFDYGPAHIVVVELKRHGDSLSATQKAWLEADLGASTKEWKFLQFHAPVYSAGGHSNNTIEQAYIQSLCETYGVAAVFCGHNHYYARAMVNGVAHITTGGGGAPLKEPEDGHPNIVVHDRSNHFCKIDIQGGWLTFEAVRLDGTVIDTFMMSH